MTKPMSTCCFRREVEVPNLKQFNISLETVNLEDKRGHYLVVNKHFDRKTANKKMSCTSKSKRKLLARCTSKSTVPFFNKRSCLVRLKNLLSNFPKLCEEKARAIL